MSDANYYPDETVGSFATYIPYNFKVLRGRYHGPTELPMQIHPNDVDHHRHFDCKEYDSCLDIAQGMPSFTCCVCNLWPGDKESD